jgi:hypothetical protein
MTRVWSPPPLAVTAPEASRALDREADAIVAVLERDGPLPTRALKARVEARFWGPGRFAPALRRAVADGRVRRVDRRTWAAT